MVRAQRSFRVSGAASVDYERLTAAELEVAAPLGFMRPALELRPTHDGSSVRRAIEREIENAVGDRPCYVLFSGGRDSSLVLAIATLVCRRIGHADPVPVTAVYPGDQLADESEWQELVLSHLGIPERLVVTVADERTALGQLATEHLRRRGLVWPEAVHTQPIFFKQLDPGTVLTGEGGDAFLQRQRITPLHLIRERRRLPNLTLARAAIEALQPKSVVRRTAHRTLADTSVLPWLRPAARERVADDEAERRGPLRWSSAIVALRLQRGTSLGLNNPVVSAAEYGLVMRHPIAEPAVVAALAAEGGTWGFRGRTNLFRHIGADLLPDAILSRRTKAAFNASRWGERERQFVAEYSGGAFDPQFIDEERLRDNWLGDHPHPAAFFLAQIAWLHQQGLPLVPADATQSPVPSADHKQR